MSKKHSGSPIKTGGSGSKETPHGGDPGIGKQKQEGATRVGTVPSDASKHDPNFGHKIKD